MKTINKKSYCHTILKYCDIWLCYILPLPVWCLTVLSVLPFLIDKFWSFLYVFPKFFAKPVYVLGWSTNNTNVKKSEGNVLLNINSTTYNVCVCVRVHVHSSCRQTDTKHILMYKIIIPIFIITLNKIRTYRSTDDSKLR